MLLHFGAVDQSCTVWVDGDEVGSHTGGYLPFTLDVTEQRARRRRGHLLEVRVRDLSETGVHARGKQRLDRGTIWYTAQSGIWQTVWLEPVPAAYVDRLVLVPELAAGAVEVTVGARGLEDPRTRSLLRHRGRPDRRTGWWAAPTSPSTSRPGPAVRGPPLVARRPAPLRRRGEPRRGPGDVLRRPALLRRRARPRRPPPPAAQRRAVRARGGARPGLLARRTADRARATRRWCTTSRR